MKKILSLMIITVSSFIYLNCDDTGTDSNRYLNLQNLANIVDYEACVQDKIAQGCIGTTDTYQECQMTFIFGGDEDNRKILIGFKSVTIDCGAMAMTCDDAGPTPTCL